MSAPERCAITARWRAIQRCSALPFLSFLFLNLWCCDAALSFVVVEAPRNFMASYAHLNQRQPTSYAPDCRTPGNLQLRRAREPCIGPSYRPVYRAVR